MFKNIQITPAIVLFLAFIVGVSLQSNAQELKQKEQITFLETEYNFGTLNEKGGPSSHRFLFVNEGKDAVMVQTAKASCGCTMPAWEHNLVQPGDTGWIDARYDPDNRPGYFNKTITVFFEKSMFKQVLKIKGFVQPPMTEPVKIYKTNIGNLRLKNKFFNMGVLETNAPVTKLFTVYNQRNTEMKLELGQELPPYLKVVFEPSVIKAKQVGNVRITFLPSRNDQFGMINDHVVIKTNDNITANKTITVSAQINEFFTEEQMKDPNRPVLSIGKNEVYLGSVEEGDKITKVFEFTNTGKSPLLIRSVFTSCDCMAFKSKKDKLKPGQTGKIKVIFDSTGKISYIQNSVTIISNDPNNPVQTVSVRGKVVDKKE